MANTRIGPVERTTKDHPERAKHSQRKFILLGDLNLRQLASQSRALTANIEVISNNPA